MRVAQYKIWVEEDSVYDMKTVEEFYRIPGYIEHEWVDSLEVD